MPIRRHPDDASLMSFAAGSLSEGLSVVIAAHVALCPTCAAEVQLMERLGAALVDDIPLVRFNSSVPTPVRKPGGRTQFAKTPIRPAAAGQPAAESLPAPLRTLIGPRLDTVVWSRLGLGIWQRPLPLSEHAKGDLRLLKVAPGRAMPDHGHGGPELTLVLDGAYHDKFGRFSVGDVADHDDDAEHRPIADPASGCVCLIASEERVRFKGLVARLVQPFAGL